MATSGSFYTTGYSGGGSPDRLIFEWTATQDVTTNTSTIVWTVKVGGGVSSGYYNTFSKRYVKVGEYQRTAGSDWLDGSQLTVYNGTRIDDLCGTTVIQHNADGSGSFAVDLRGMFQYSFVGNNYVYNSRGSTTFALDVIPRKAEITSASDFTDESNPFLMYTNPAGSAASLRVGLSLDGTTADIPYRSAMVGNGTIVFSFTLSDAELATLKNAATTPSIPIYYLLETTIGTDTFVDVVQRSFSVADTETNKPTLSVQTSPMQSIQTLPSPLQSEFIQMLSRVFITANAQGRDSAEIASVEVIFEGFSHTSEYTGQTSVTDLETSNPIESSGAVPLTVRATDSRGHVKEVTTTITVIPYAYPYLTGASVARCDTNGVPANDGRNLKIKATRAFSLLTVSGTNYGKAKIEYRYKRASQAWSSQAWTTLMGFNDQGVSPNYYEGVADPNTQNLFDETVAYTVQLRCYDYPAGNSSTLEFDIPTEAVVLHLKEGGKGIGVGKYCTADNELQIAYKAVFEDDVDLSNAAVSTITDAIKNSILNLAYPVGSIYMSVNSTSPATLFGGTWTRIEDTFLLAAGNTYNAGDTGGSADLQAHTHSFGADFYIRHGTSNADSVAAGNNTSVTANSYSQTWGNGFNISSYSHKPDKLAISGDTGSTGDGNGGNMPPYLTVYMWKRTA